MEKKDVICFKGDRNKWIDFMAKVKKNRKEVWEVLSGLIDQYMRGK